MNFPTPKNLYHYTSLEALAGILKSDSIWATAAEYLNDPAEGRYQNASIAKEMADLCKQEHPTPEFNTYSVEWFSSLIEKMIAMRGQTYIFSLSKSSESAAQWMAYGKYGKGVCIEFAGSEISKIGPEILNIDNNGATVLPLEVTYLAPENVNTKARSLLNEVLDLVGNEFYPNIQHPMTPDAALQGLIRCNPNSDQNLRFRARMTLSTMSFKHPAYESEQEVRLVSNYLSMRTDVPHEFRIRNDEIIPYQIWSVKSNNSRDEKALLPITRIIAGPALSENQVRAIRSLAEINDYKHIAVSHSEVPLRS
jgi:Protein of unknown function (DUF2971)